MMLNCEECRCWLARREPRDEPPVAGECRRHAPRPGAGRAEWPVTMALDWCAEGLPHTAPEDPNANEE